MQTQHAGICYAYDLPIRWVDKLITLSLNCCACTCRVIITPRACARSKIIGCVIVVVVIVSTKIAISRDAGV